MKTLQRGTILEISALIDTQCFSLHSFMQFVIYLVLDKLGRDCEALVVWIARIVAVREYNSFGSRSRIDRYIVNCLIPLHFDIEYQFKICDVLTNYINRLDGIPIISSDE